MKHIVMLRHLEVEHKYMLRILDQLLGFLCIGIWTIFKIHQWRRSIVKTVDSNLRINCYFVLVRSGTIYGFNHETPCLIFYGLAILTMKLSFLYQILEHLHILCVFQVEERTQLQYIRRSECTRCEAPSIFGSTNLSNIVLSPWLTQIF